MLKIYLNYVLLISDKLSDVKLFSLFILVYVGTILDGTEVPNWI